MHSRLRVERTMVRVRWVGVVFALAQALTFYRPYPPGILEVALGLVLLLAVGNVAVAVATPRLRDERQALRLSLATLVLDAVIVLGLVFVYAFDPDTAMFALVYLLPLEGAIRFRRAGALWVMGVATAVYTLREVFGAVVYGTPLLVVSITFRMGIGWLIAWVAGAMASNLARERDEVATAKAAVERSLAQVQELNAELRAANEVKDDFLAVTNHELRTPLTAILGYSLTLRHRWDRLPDGPRFTAVEHIADQARRLLDLVEDLLTLSSGRAMARDARPVPVRVADAVAGAVAGSGPDGVAVHCSAELEVLADPRLLERILVNLLTNARKYGAPPFSVEVRAAGTRVELSVADCGAGVPEPFVQRLFDKFTQAESGATRAAQGTGLGLAIVRELAAMQGGDAWYEPNEPSGARFCISLPAVTAPEKMTATSSSRSQ
ncbi:MAG: HAMP domain-containing histidine kinase [Euzebyales bacterium]|nr:HAMP domain-containing histidine kinase [Euzebyales bacterium]